MNKEYLNNGNNEEIKHYINDMLKQVNTISRLL